MLYDSRNEPFEWWEFRDFDENQYYEDCERDYQDYLDEMEWRQRNGFS